LLALLPLYAAPAFLADLSRSEKAALRREMVEYDITIRELASNIAMRYKNTAQTNARYLASSPVIAHIEYGKDYKKVRALFAKNGLDSHFVKIETEAAALDKYFKTVSSNTDTDWNKVLKSYSAIVNECGACHAKTGVQ